MTRPTKLGRIFPMVSTSSLGGGGGTITDGDGDGAFPGPGTIPTATGSNTWAWGSNIATITVNQTTKVLGPHVNIANGSNTTVTVDMVGAVASNTIRIHATGGAASFGSNATHVAEISAGGASSDSARMDHYHAGIAQVTASSSNTMQRGTWNVRAGTGIALALTDTDGDGEFDTTTIVNTSGGGGGGGAPTTAKYVVTEADGSLSAEVVHPYLADNSGGSDVDMSGAATGTGVSVTAVTGTIGRVNWTDNSAQYWDVASGVGTGDFDYRIWIISHGLNAAGSGNTNNSLLYFGVTDSGRTTTTGLYAQFQGFGANANILTRGFTGLSTALTPTINHAAPPFILRVKRVGTTVDRFVSVNNGLTWIFVATSTSSLNVAKLGLWCNPNGTSNQAQTLVGWVRSV